MYEIQFHPADIRKQVRYYFLSLSSYRLLIAAVALLAAVTVAGIVLAPLGVQALMLSGALRALRQQNRLQMEILDQRTVTLDRVGKAVDAARNRQLQMSLILGAPQNSAGLGGFPSEPVGRDISVLEAAAAADRGQELDTQTRALLMLSDELADFARAHEELAQAVPSICPVPVGSFVLTSPFGHRVSPFTNASDFHSGIDLAAREGTPVLAAGGGRVVYASRFPLRRNVRWWRYGNVVVMSHDGGYITIYAHLQDIQVRRGQQLTRGEQLGTVGNTGWSTSPHLHYEVRADHEDTGEPVPVDPRIFILDYQWTGHEALLVRGRSAPALAFDPLPSLVKVR
jgi:murein DD-endopeptidase MepM/ murein hydrolase activator NlpD